MIAIASVLASSGAAIAGSETNTSNLMVAAERQCKDGMRWGYAVKAHAPKKTIKAIDPNGNEIKVPLGVTKEGFVVTGAFETADKCEEARLTDPNSVPDGTYRLYRCEKRYIGRSVQVNLVKIDVMDGKPSMFGVRAIAYFSSLEKCKAARLGGYERPTSDSQAPDDFKKIFPFGSDGRPRFIGDCSSFSQIVCKQGSDEAITVPLLE